MIGENIRRIRKDKGLTQAYVARQAGITQAMLCWIERGTRNPPLQVGMAIAKVLGCTVDDLLAGYEPGAMENDSQQEGA